MTTTTLKAALQSLQHRKKRLQPTSRRLRTLMRMPTRGANAITNFIATVRVCYAKHMPIESERPCLVGILAVDSDGEREKSLFAAEVSPRIGPLPPLPNLATSAIVPRLDPPSGWVNRTRAGGSTAAAGAEASDAKDEQDDGTQLGNLTPVDFERPQTTLNQAAAGETVDANEATTKSTDIAATSLVDLMDAFDPFAQATTTQNISEI